ncbi:hypothetical protein [Mangrovibacterium sp.]|uniref:hypothetical protein n=1 Tax=Mangrovibacterium sp. TaxID=1961364 RepID=UPI0035654373
MLEFKINNRDLLLDESASIRITFINPCCKTDIVSGDVGMGIEIPVNDNNRALFGYPERFEKYISGNAAKFPGFEARWSGALLLSGTLQIQKATAQSYSAWLQCDIGVIGDEMKNKFITQLAWPTAQNFEHKEEYNDDIDNYETSKIKNPIFWEGNGSEVPAPVNYTDEDGYTDTRDESWSIFQKDHFENYGWIVNNYNIADIKSACIISPFIYLRYAINESMRLNQFFVDRNDMTDDDNYDTSFLKNIKIYNNFNIVNPLTITTEEYWQQWNKDNQRYEDYYLNIVTNTLWEVVKFNYSDLLPKVSFKNFILGVQNTLNYIFFFKSGKRVDIIDRNGVSESTTIELDDYHIETWEIDETKDVTLKFTQEYDKDDGKFGDSFEDLSHRREDYGEPVDNYSDLLLLTPEIGELRLVLSDNKVYEYKWVAETQKTEYQQNVQADAVGWVAVSTGLQPYFYGTADDEEEINSPASTLQYDGYNHYMPIVRQKGNLQMFASTYNDFSLRFIYGTSTHTKSLYWEGENGLFKKRWEKWARMWKNRLAVEAVFNMPINAILHVANNITGKFSTREGEFIIDEMDVEIGFNSIGKTTIRGYKI